MVWLPQGYCIDSTEVTVGQFNKWLATKPTPPKLGEVCGRTSFGPSVSCMASGYVCKKACDNYPVVCVDWCDASAYCKAAGKRLCGAIGGGPIGQHDYADPTVDQWFNACSANGKNIYPYGDDYGPKTCNGADLRVANSHPVAYAPECQSTEPGYLGIYDMSGNVWEWEDFCYEQDGLVLCNARGGSFYDGERDMQCNAVYNWVPMIGETPRNERTRASDSFGFRCCS
jgi:formylglycine-generating enzyme required for sulfatase activity